MPSGLSLSLARRPWESSMLLPTPQSTLHVAKSSANNNFMKIRVFLSKAWIGIQESALARYVNTHCGPPAVSKGYRAVVLRGG